MYNKARAKKQHDKVKKYCPFADVGQVKKYCCFADFGQVKKYCHFADFGQVNFLLDKTPLGETGCLTNFLGSLSMSPALHPGFSDLLRSPPALSSTPTTCVCLLFLMFRHPVF